MTTDANHFTMSELVARTNVPAATIRYYALEGLLPPATKISSNRFLYDERHVEAIRLVRLLRERRNLPLEAIRHLLPDLVPDVLGQPEGGVFHPEMWGEVITTRSQRLAGPSVAERLVQAGLAIFARDGYDEVTIEQICQATAIAKGSFYRHYASKEALFFAVARAAGKEISLRFRSLDGPEAGQSDRAIAVLTEAITPYLPILFDLSSQAARRRPGHGAVLAAIAGQIEAETGVPIALARRSEAGLFERALADAVRRIAADPPLGAPEALPLAT